MAGFDKYAIKVLDRTGGAQLSYISSTAGRPALLGGGFSIARLGGCDKARLRLAADQVSGNINPSNLLEIWVQPVGGSLSRYWRGYITRSGQKTGSTAKEYEIEAVGLWRQVERQILVKFFDADDIDNIISDILAEILAGTDLESSTSEISVASPYTLGDAEFQYQPASSAIKMLAEVQGDTDYGVDQDGKLYFIDSSSSVVAKYWTGKHINEYEPEGRADRLITHLIMQSKKIVGGGFLTFERVATLQEALYGRFSKLVQIPHLQDPNDVWAWGGNILARSKSIQSVAGVTLPGFTDFRFPRGEVTIEYPGGSADYPIQKTVYNFDENAGFMGRFEVGSEPPLELKDEIKAILQSIEVSNRANISLTEIEHTRGQEWAQEAIIDGRKQGNYNIFTDSFDNVKAIDEDSSFHIWFDTKRNYVGCGLEQAKATYQSNIIPSGREVDTIRLHYDADFYGRINFAIDEDLPDFWINPASPNHWIVGSSKSALAQDNTAPTAGSHLVYNAAEVFTFPQTYKIKFSVIDWQATPGVTPSVRYNYLDINNYNDVLFTNGAVFLTIQWRKRVAGVTTVLQTVNALKDRDYEYEITARNTGTTASFKGWQIGGTDTFSVSSVAHPMTANLLVGPNNFINGVNPQPCWMGYFEIQEVGDVDIWISRDGGTTFTAATVTHGKNNVDVNVSGQPAGTEIVLKGEITHPARLYGWGVSFAS